LVVQLELKQQLAPAEWVEGCSRMDLILGSSKSYNQCIEKFSKFEKRDQQTNQTMGYVEWKGDR
jgi:hypothetical protein